MTDAAVTLRPATPADAPFFEALYASTRHAELAVTGWPQARIDAFLSSQFALQSAHYAQHYADASFQAVELDGRRVGRLIVATWPAEVRLVDVALAADVRGRGIGTGLVRGVMDAAEGRPVTIHVEQFNPALRLYERLGFRRIGETGAYWLMEAR